MDGERGGRMAANVLEISAVVELLDLFDFSKDLIELASLALLLARSRFLPMVFFGFDFEAVISARALDSCFDMLMSSSRPAGTETETPSDLFPILLLVLDFINCLFAGYYH